jgi:hypothetical protein
MLDEDSARGIGVADGEVLDPAGLDPRLGLALMLFLRERKPVLEFDVVAGARCRGRAGEASREDNGDLGDGEPDACSARPPASVVWCFIGAVDAPSDPIVGVFCSLVELVVAGALGAGVIVGSADSSAPVMDWKPASLASEVIVVLCRQMTALVACWVQCATIVLCCRER